MSQLNDYENIVVVQRNRQTGCIPSAIEWMFRYRGTDIPDDFQERYDLAVNRIVETNTFSLVSSAVNRDFRDINFEIRNESDFEDGNHKLSYIEEKISSQIPCLISITQRSTGGWHCVPVIEINSRSVIVLWMDNPIIGQQIRRYPRRNLARIHDDWPGGKDTLSYHE